MKQKSSAFFIVDLVENALNLKVELHHLHWARSIVAIGLHNTIYLFAVFYFDEYQIGVRKQQVQIFSIIVSLNGAIREPEQHNFLGLYFKNFNQIHQTLFTDERLALKS